MRSLVTVTLLLFAAVCANAAKPCEDMKAEIAKKLEANNVKNYSLDIVPTEKVKDTQRVVASCEGGTKKIVYNRTATPAAKPAAAPSATQPNKQ
jgi:hypothetical protein